MTKTRADARHDFVVETVLQSSHRGREYTRFAAALIADNFGPLNADQRSHVAAFPKALGDLIGNKVSVGEDLKVNVRMRFENFEQLFVHERLAAQQAEKRVAHFLGRRDHPVHRFDIDLVLLGGNVNPATGAAEVAGVDDRDVEVGGKELPVAKPAFVLLNASPAFEAHVPAELPEQTLVCFQ